MILKIYSCASQKDKVICIKKNAYGAKQTGVAKNVLQEKKQKPNQK